MLSDITFEIWEPAAILRQNWVIHGLHARRRYLGAKTEQHGGDARLGLGQKPVFRPPPWFLRLACGIHGLSEMGLSESLVALGHRNEMDLRSNLMERLQLEAFATK